MDIDDPGVFPGALGVAGGPYQMLGKTRLQQQPKSSTHLQRGSEDVEGGLTRHRGHCWKSDNNP